MNILLVEDDPTDRKLFSAVLQAGGHHIFEKGSAEQAVREIQRHQPEVILLDLKLPGMDGLELARRLKADPATCHIPIIAITAAREIYTKAAALSAGCDAYIAKPVDTRKLNGQVASAAGQTPRRPAEE